MSNLLAKFLTRSFPSKETSLYAESRFTETPDSMPDSQSSVYESRAFAMWGGLLDKTTGNRILELGALNSRSLGYFAERTALLSVMSLSLEESPITMQSQLDKFTPDQPFDGSLCWDLPNYMSEADFQRLGTWLGQNMRSGGAVMLCLATKIPYPKLPGRYEIVSKDRLQFQASKLETEGRQYRMSTADLGRQWEDFQVERSFLLRNGLQEYVLRRRAA